MKNEERYAKWEEQEVSYFDTFEVWADGTRDRLEVFETEEAAMEYIAECKADMTHEEGYAVDYVMEERVETQEVKVYDFPEWDDDF